MDAAMSQDDMAETSYTLICKTNYDRVDKFLAASLPNLSRSQIQRLITDDRVLVAGLTLKPSSSLPAGTQLTISVPAAPSETIVPQNIPLDRLFEDEHIVVINKPAGLVVHPAAGHADGTLVNALVHRYPNMAGLHPQRPGIVHRLDRDTSGVMVIAKTQAALTALQQQFKARTVEKIYLALVYGQPQSPEGIIDVPLGRHPKLRQIFAAQPNGKPARTHYSIERTFQGYSLLSIKLETGRTHQIRVHLAWLGHPVVGDSVYGRRKNSFGLTRQFLHAHRLRFQHPVGLTPAQFETPLPPDLADCLQQLSN